MNYYKILVLSLFIWSCQNFNNTQQREIVARVNDAYLYKDDLEKIIPKNTAKNDSVNLAKNYINTWATRQLFIDQAKRNLSEAELQEFDDLIESYQNTLYINAYKNAVVKKSIDLEITDQDIKSFYDKNLENFNLNEEILKLRYLHLPPDYGDIVATQTRLNRFNEEDKQELESRKLEYLQYSTNDSTWIKFDEILNKISILKKQKKSDILKKGNYIQLRDSTGVYMVKIKDVLNRNQIAPLTYVTPTIRQIILNKRKLELVKKIEKDITKDAVENKQFEVYE
ncbi:peptidyl-prolyl cis-trans isomerase [Aquimarina algicola]|uniref:Peptidyl-prolyl cis-trans isomerase n=1 Tax=Aquimarina algicola TaxID=2589995 RepID=A0A504J330_9FLAO|nr:peptidyl-prolyl cis-trans isomerase [Aquimarina algicola]TPN85346.1 peptidyl-prolyl cis-trans isomerase [Aquimarina algicola]